MLRRLRAAVADTWGFLRARPAHLAAVLAAGAGGALSGVPVANDAFTYLWADDRFCNDCHVHDYANDAYARSAHAGLTTCHDCHTVPLRHYPRNLWVTVADPPQGPEDIPVPHVEDRICRSCHAADGAAAHITGPMPDELRATVRKIDGSPLHDVHLDVVFEDGTSPTCMTCHGGEGQREHAFRAAQVTCEGCHEVQQQGAHAMGALACRECHFGGFTSP
jgi:ribosomal protein L40E